MVDRKRRRLARAVRRYARAEHEQYHRGGVVELASIGARAELYQRIADRLEADGPLAARVLAELEHLLAEAPPVRDYGAAAQARNARIAGILAGLGGSE
jgi:hypothetical protein